MFTTAGFTRATRSAKPARWAMGGTVTGGLLSLAAIAPAARKPPPPASTVVASRTAAMASLLRENLRLVLEGLLGWGITVLPNIGSTGTTAKPRVGKEWERTL